MTAYNQTVINNLWPFSNATPDLWGTMLWGDLWGATPYAERFDVRHLVSADGPTLTSADVRFDVRHLVSADGPVLTSADARFDVRHLVSADGPTLTSETIKYFLMTISAGEITLDGDMTSEELSDGNGYTYVFGDHIEGENRSLTSFTSGALVDVTYTVGTSVGTIWS